MHCRTVRASVTPPCHFASSIHPPGVTIRTHSRHCPVSPRGQNHPQLRTTVLRVAAQSCPTPCDPVDCSTQASLSITNFGSLLKLVYIESVMPSNHLILRTSAGLTHRSLHSIAWLCSGPVSAPVAPCPTPSLTGSFASTWRGKSHHQLTCNFDRSSMFVTHEL